MLLFAASWHAEALRGTTPVVTGFSEVSLFSAENEGRVGLIRGVDGERLHGRSAQGKGSGKEQSAESGKQKTMHGQGCEKGLLLL